MSSERDAIVASRRPQPGGRAPAPGRLAVVQTFINSHYDLERDHGAELLHSPAALVEWLRRAGLLDATVRADDVDLDRALVVREELRELASDEVLRPRRLNDAARGATVELRVAPDGQLGFVAAPGAGVAGALGVLLAITAVAVADGSWSRLKICPGEDCGWAFFDASRNRSGRWCSMSVCGGRAKARTYYARRRTTEA